MGYPKVVHRTCLGWTPDVRSGWEAATACIGKGPTRPSKTSAMRTEQNNNDVQFHPTSTKKQGPSLAVQRRAWQTTAAFLTEFNCRCNNLYVLTTSPQEALRRPVRWIRSKVHSVNSARNGRSHGVLCAFQPCADHPRRPSARSNKQGHKPSLPSHVPETPPSISRLKRRRPASPQDSSSSKASRKEDKDRYDPELDSHQTVHVG